MKWRWAQKEDFADIREIWTRANYGFDFPDLASKRMLSSWVAVEDSKIVAWAGAQLRPEISALVDPDWGGPHQRQKLFATLHQPIAQEVRDAGYDKAFCCVDQPRFGRCLRRLGWHANGLIYWITGKAILR